MHHEERGDDEAKEEIAEGQVEDVEIGRVVGALRSADGRMMDDGDGYTNINFHCSGERFQFWPLAFHLA